MPHNTATRPIQVWGKPVKRCLKKDEPGLVLALRFVNKRVMECQRDYDEWQAKFERGECEQISVATERSATFEAEYIQKELRKLLHGDG